MKRLNEGKEERKRVLICEDEKSISKILSIYLTDCGYEVVTAENGEIAISLLNTNEFDVVITDIEMPFYDGYDVTRAARHLRKIPYLFILTGCNKREIEESVKDMNINGLFEKPFSLYSISYALGKIS